MNRSRKSKHLFHIFILLICLMYIPASMANKLQINSGAGQNRPLIIFVGGVGDSASSIIGKRSKIVLNLAYTVAENINYQGARIYYMDHESEEEVVAQIAQHRCQFPFAKIVLVGHSMGGDTVIDLRS